MKEHRLIIEMKIRLELDSSDSLSEVAAWERKLLARAELLDRKVYLSEPKHSRRVERRIAKMMARCKDSACRRSA